MKYRPRSGICRELDPVWTMGRSEPRITGDTCKVLKRASIPSNDSWKTRFAGPAWFLFPVHRVHDVFDIYRLLPLAIVRRNMIQSTLDSLTERLLEKTSKKRKNAQWSGQRCIDCRSIEAQVSNEFVSSLCGCVKCVCLCVSSNSIRSSSSGPLVHALGPYWNPPFPVALLFRVQQRIVSLDGSLSSGGKKLANTLQASISRPKYASSARH